MTKHDLKVKMRNHCFANPSLSAVLALSKRFASEATYEQRRCRLLYHISPAEMRLYDFEHRTEKEKSAYISTSERTMICKTLNDPTDSYNFTRNKYTTWQHFKPLYKRDALLVSNCDDIPLLHTFLKQYRSCVIKPIDSEGGNGIYKLKEDDDIDGIARQNLEKGSFIAEECILQDPRMGILHPASVNTLRIVTIYDAEKDKRHDLFAIIRVGKGGSFVDNVHAGGYAAEVDFLTGKVISDATSFEGITDSVHPDTGMRFKDFQVPEWESLIVLLDKAVRLIPRVRHVGWDFALSDKGWCIVEVNRAPSYASIQQRRGKGLRDPLYSCIPENILKDPFKKG